MDKQITNAPGAEALAQPRSRRDFFKTLAVAGAGAAVGSTVLTRKASAQSGTSDADIGNFALTLEYLEADFYTKAVDAGVLSGNALAIVTALRDHENAHVDAITKFLQAAGATPVAKPTFTFPSDAFSSQDSILKLAATFEPVGVGAYLGQAPLIQSPDLLAAAGSIVGVEDEHVVAINSLFGNVVGVLEPFPAAMTKEEVLNAIAPFLGMSQMPNTGGASGGGPFRAI